MNIEPFTMERFQSLWENIVDYNLSESGVYPYQLHEIITKEELKELVMTPLGYQQTNGSEMLRAAICDLYPGAAIENILVTTGSSEANFLSTWGLIEPGDEVALMLPNYMQIWGVARAFGANVKPFHFIAKDNRWQVDWDEFERVVSSKTKLIAICNPNNPTGAQLNRDEIKRICEEAVRVNAYVLADEVYRGAERDGGETPTCWGSYDKIIVTGGLSKAYGLPGLRIGWIVAPPGLVEKLWSYHDYTSICSNPLSDLLARIALDPQNRIEILGRTRTILNRNFKILKHWIDSHENVLECIPPAAGAIALVKYQLKMKSIELVTKLREEKSVLIVPGAHFFMENYLRFGFGARSEYLQKALERVSEFINEIGS